MALTNKGNMESQASYVLAYYEIPLISVNWLLAAASKYGQEKQFDKAQACNTARWHADRCCHPFWWGHDLLALSFAYAVQASSMQAFTSIE